MMDNGIKFMGSTITHSTLFLKKWGAPEVMISTLVTRIGVFKCLGKFGAEECLPVLQAAQEKLKDESARQAAEEDLAAVRAR